MPKLSNEDHRDRDGDSDSSGPGSPRPQQQPRAPNGPNNTTYTTSDLPHGMCSWKDESTYLSTEESQSYFSLTSTDVNLTDSQQKFPTYPKVPKIPVGSTRLHEVEAPMSSRSEKVKNSCLLM